MSTTGTLTIKNSTGYNLAILQAQKLNQTTSITLVPSDMAYAILAGAQATYTLNNSDSGMVGISFSFLCGMNVGNILFCVSHDGTATIETNGHGVSIVPTNPITPTCEVEIKLKTLPTLKLKLKNGSGTALSTSVNGEESVDIAKDVSKTFENVDYANGITITLPDGTTTMLSYLLSENYFIFFQSQLITQIPYAFKALKFADPLVLEIEFLQDGGIIIVGITDMLPGLNPPPSK